MKGLKHSAIKACAFCPYLDKTNQILTFDSDDNLFFKNSSSIKLERKKYGGLFHEVENKL